MIFANPVVAVVVGAMIGMIATWNNGPVRSDKQSEKSDQNKNESH